MDRKYRQRGYNDSGRDRPAKKTSRPAENFGPKTPHLPGAHEVTRCANCGKVLPPRFDSGGKCPFCAFELHSCKQCSYFDTSQRYECSQPIPARIPRKDARNECTFYAPRVTLERQTAPDSFRAQDPRKAFEDLFKK
ncbi:MAG: hypothetical protein ACRD3T_00695 [Terriglobia bacterium]